MRVAPRLRGEAWVVPLRVVATVTDARGPDGRLGEIMLPLLVEERVEGTGARIRGRGGGRGRRAALETRRQRGEGGEHQTPGNKPSHGAEHASSRARDKARRNARVRDPWQYRSQALVFS